MIFNPRQQFYRALFLRARHAARRFVTHRVNVRAREIGWRPIALRWRKRGKHLGNVIIRRAAGSIKFLSFPQSHFHFANYQIHRGSKNISRNSVLSTRVFDTRIIRELPEGKGEDSIRTSRVFLDNHFHRSSGDLNQSTRTSRDVQTPNWSNSKLTKADATQSQLQRPSKFLFSRPAVTGLRPFSTKADGASPFRTQSRVQQHWRLMPGAQSRNEQNSRTDDRAQTRRSALQFYRAEELFWRRVSKTTTEINECVRHLESIEPADRPSLRSTSNQPGAVDMARVMEQVAAMPITKLHPALIDRLANDVIRRVEQRVRIERERRGL